MTSSKPRPAPLTITPEELEAVWGTRFSPWMNARVGEKTLRYEALTQHEQDQAVLKVLKTLDGRLTRSGEHRLPSWEEGWRQNLDAFKQSGSLDDLAPRYFGKEPLVRWKQSFIRPLDSTFEYGMFGLLLDWILDDWLSEPPHVYEFGCGTGHNLLRIRERYPQSRLVGLDWAESSQETLRHIAQELGDTRLEAARFDYFNPDTSLALEEGSTVLTVASLEQTGGDFRNFIDYLLAQPVECVVHVEPIWELLDPDNLMDYLSIRYFYARNYLDGLVQYLRMKESVGELTVLRDQRSFVGSFYVDGYSVVMWRPATLRDNSGLS